MSDDTTTPDTKPGYQTSEFWATAAGTILAAAATALGLPITDAATISGGLIALYNIGRVIVKTAEAKHKAAAVSQSALITKGQSQPNS